MNNAMGPLPAVSDLLLPLPGAGRRARDVITEACVQWDVADLVAPASLIATELVNNAVEHAQTMTDLQVTCDHRQLLIQVTDGSPVVPAMPAPSVIAAER